MCPFLFLPPSPVLSQYIPFYEVRRNIKNKISPNFVRTDTFFVFNSFTPEFFWIEFRFVLLLRRRTRNVFYRPNLKTIISKIKLDYLWKELCNNEPFGGDLVVEMINYWCALLRIPEPLKRPAGVKELSRFCLSLRLLISPGEIQLKG